MRHQITLDLGSLKLEQATLRTVYGGIARLANNEPGLLSAITFDGSRLTLLGVSDSGEQVLAKLYDYLGNLPLQKRLESLLIFEPTRLEREIDSNAPAHQVA